MSKRLRIPIAFKLIAITVLLLAGSAAMLTWFSANRFEDISISREQDSNLDQSQARAREVEGLLVSYIEKAKVVAAQLLKDSYQERERSLELTFRRDSDLVSVEVLPRVAALEPIRVVNESYLHVYRKDKTFIDVLRATQKNRQSLHPEALFSGRDGYVEIRNSTIGEGAPPLLTIGFPLAKDDYGNVTHVVLAEVRLDKLQKIFASVKERTMYLLDADGGLLAHPEEARVIKGEAFKDHPIFKAAMSNQFRQGQSRFKEPGSKQAVTAAYTKTPLGVLAIAQVSDAVILEPARVVRRKAIFWAGQIVSATLVLVFLFSITLTSPLESLAELTSQVARGNFSARAKVRSRDEVGQLGDAFNHMIEGLLERDKVKTLFNKFHGSSVTEDLLKGNLELGGSKKTVTVFFSDIRGFTKFSEGHTPEQVVEMLNEYFQIMVGIINKHGGVVDKFIGDAIMAVWGAPNANERDTQNALHACLDMRRALKELNDLRATRNQVPIMIGMGVHRGEAISGTIGSSERMEYTVIGDTVNQSSRIEAATKTFGTDLLVSQDMAHFVGEEFLLEEAGSVEVKGKAEPLKLFKVRGYVDHQHNPVVVQTPYSEYAPSGAEKIKIA